MKSVLLAVALTSCAWGDPVVEYVNLPTPTNVWVPGDGTNQGHYKRVGGVSNFPSNTIMTFYGYNTPTPTPGKGNGTMQTIAIISAMLYVLWLIPWIIAAPDAVETDNNRKRFLFMFIGGPVAWVVVITWLFIGAGEWLGNVFRK